MSSSATRCCCNQAVEDTLHAVRDCKVTREISNALIPQGLVAEFFALGLTEWVDLLLNTEWNNPQSRGTERMMLVCNMQWHWRNEEIFNGGRMEIQRRLKLVHDMFEEDSLFQRTEKMKQLEMIRPSTYAGP